MMNDFPSTSKVRNNIVSYSSYSVPKNLRNSSSTTDMKNVKWQTTSNLGNEGIEDSYKSNIRSSFKNSNIPVYTNNRNQTISASSSANFGWDNGTYSPTTTSSSYSNSPKKYLKNRSSFDMQLNNTMSKIPVSASVNPLNNNINNNNISSNSHNSYLNSLTKMSPKELENLLRSLTLRKVKLFDVYINKIIYIYILNYFYFILEYIIL